MVFCLKQQAKRMGDPAANFLVLAVGCFAQAFLEVLHGKGRVVGNFQRQLAGGRHQVIMGHGFECQANALGLCRVDDVAGEEKF
jgi:hypothetical protein